MLDSEPTNGISRRQLLTGTAAVAMASMAFPWGTRPAKALAPKNLDIVSRTLEVNGRAAKVLGIVQPNGQPGLVTSAGERFQVTLINRLSVPSLIHWHGLTPPTAQDGVPGLSQPVLSPGGTYSYDFPLPLAGTNWMHSHFGLQEQQLLAAPLIIRDPADKARDEQEVVVLLHDFTFRNPEEILAELSGGAGHQMIRAAEEKIAASAGMDHSAMGHDTPIPQPHTSIAEHGAAGGHSAVQGAARPSAGAPSHGVSNSTSGTGAVDLHDVEFDAYLANDRTLADPEIVRVEPSGRIRLRVINGAAATNFHLDLGRLNGELIAVDGVPISPPRHGSRFELAIAQRADVRVRLPRGQGAYPVLAIREGDTPQTGIILATSGAQIARVPDRAAQPAKPVGLDLERTLSATVPLSQRPAERLHTLALTGSMMQYTWTLNGAKFGEHSPLMVRKGQRVEVLLRNDTEMAHPMHLHGHHFQVVAINGKHISGAVRDTILVPIGQSVKIAFDADNPGHWAFHCHHLYHMVAGMMTSVKYEDA